MPTIPTYWAFGAMPAIPRERIVGPFPQPPEWGGLLAAVAAFRAGLGDCIVQPSQALLDGAYAAFAILAEAELQQVIGSSCKVGCRARPPRLIRKSFRNQGLAKKLDPVGEARQPKWLKGRALEALLASREPGWIARLIVLRAIVANNPPWLDGVGRADELHKWLCVCMRSVICIPESAEPALPADVLELARLASDCDRAVSHDNM